MSDGPSDARREMEEGGWTIGGRASGSRPAPCSGTPETYVFVRAEGWYPLELKDDVEACKNAECNPGTLKVITKSGRHVWPNKALSKSHEIEPQKLPKLDA